MRRTNTHSIKCTSVWLARHLCASTNRYRSIYGFYHYCVTNTTQMTLEMSIQQILIPNPNLTIRLRIAHERNDGSWIDQQPVEAKWQHLHFHLPLGLGGHLPMLAMMLSLATCKMQLHINQTLLLRSLQILQPMNGFPFVQCMGDLNFARYYGRTWNESNRRWTCRRSPSTSKILPSPMSAWTICATSETMNL